MTTKSKKTRRGSYWKVRKGRGARATCYIVDTYNGTDEVLHEGIKTRKQAEKMLKDLKAESSYQDWV
jgi:hypothetical protein